MNKVYLLYSINEREYPFVEAVCSSFSRAKEKQKQIEEKIQNIKTAYYLEYNSDYDEDHKKWTTDYESENWEETADRIILYKAKHRELFIKRFEIQEKEVE